MNATEISTATSQEPNLGHGFPLPETGNNDYLEIPTVDISEESHRHVVIAKGTAQLYHGHPTTHLLPDGETVLCTWTQDHGGPCGFMKRSRDRGKTWSDYIALPENWRQTKNCPTIFRLPNPDGAFRLFVYAGQGLDGLMQYSVSDDEGNSWSPMQSTGLKCVMPFCSILPCDGGKTLLGLTNIRRPGDPHCGGRSNILAQSRSFDGGYTWSEWEVILDDPGFQFCEPWVVVSPGGDEWSCLVRENLLGTSYVIVSRDEGKTWSKASPLPKGLSGDRHISRYSPDGRLVVAFRDRLANGANCGHFVAWVGHYSDLNGAGEGQYRVKLLHSYNGPDCGYPGLEVFDDGRLFATTYIKYRPGNELNSVVGVNFSLSELDVLGKPLGSH